MKNWQHKDGRLQQNAVCMIGRLRVIFWGLLILSPLFLVGMMLVYNEFKSPDIRENSYVARTMLRCAAQALREYTNQGELPHPRAGVLPTDDKLLRLKYTQTLSPFANINGSEIIPLDPYCASGQRDNLALYTRVRPDSSTVRLIKGGYIRYEVLTSRTALLASNGPDEDVDVQLRTVQSDQAAKQLLAQHSRVGSSERVVDGDILFYLDLK